MKKNITLLSIILLTSLTINAQSKKVKRLKASYIESSIMSFNNKMLSVIKWENKDTLRYHIEGKLKYMSKKNWNKFTNEITRLTNITFIETDDIDASEIKIYFGDIKKYFKTYNIPLPRFGLNPNFDSWSSRRYNRNRQLTYTNFCISPSKINSSTRGTYVLKKMFLNSIGILGKANNEYSMFHKQQTKTNIRLSRTDKKIIRIHYNKAIKAGMKMNDLQTALNTIDLEKILKQK